MEPREVLGKMFASGLTALKDNTSLEDELTARGVSFGDLAMSLVGTDDPVVVDQFKKQAEAQFGGSDGGNLYLIKKVAYPVDHLDDFVAVLDTQSTDQWNTVILSSENVQEIGYRASSAGIEAYLVRSDTEKDAVDRTFDSRVEPFMSVNGFYVGEPDELKIYDQMVTDLLTEPDRAQEILEPLFDLLGV